MSSESVFAFAHVCVYVCLHMRMFKVEFALACLRVYASDTGTGAGGGTAAHSAGGGGPYGVCALGVCLRLGVICMFKRFVNMYWS